MKIPAKHALVRPVTIPELARLVGTPRNTLWRHVMLLHARCRAGNCGSELAGEPHHRHWLSRFTVGAWRVSVSRLKLGHPEMFDIPTPGEMHEQIVEVQEYGLATRKQLNALAAAMREHRVRGHAVG